MKKIRTHYQNLQVTENASIEVIRGAYKYLAQKWHPDKNPSDRAKAEQVTKILNAAYEILSDPELRKNYDQKIALQRSAESEGQQEQTRRDGEGRQKQEARKEAEARRQEWARQDSEARRQERSRQEAMRQEWAREAEARHHKWTRQEAERGKRQTTRTPDPVSASGGNEYVSAIKKYAAFAGKATRKEYWMFVLYNLLVSFAIGFVEGVVDSTDQFVSVIYALAVFIPSISVGVRRMHDTNRSGWWLFLPIVNLVFLCQRSVDATATERSKVPVRVVVILASFGLAVYIGILAAIVLPAYKDYTTRAKLSPPLADLADNAQTVDHWRKAAEQGDARAQFNLGVMYGNGRVVPQDAGQAVAWYRKAAEQRYAKAEYNLGVIYRDGQGVPQDYKQAVNWFRKAAEQGDASAQYNLGAMYAQGLGVAQDYKQAVDWLRKAAEQGDVDAEYNLGVIYRDGQGVPQDYKQAVNWFRKAAEQGDASAQYNFGIMYAEGQGVAQDYVEAYKWLNLAAASGDEDTIKYLRIVAESMTPAQIAKALNLSSEWQPVIR